jgi:DNA invertase Pin-like site-specific DNA recombinase
MDNRGMALIGYARVSTQDQNLDLQLDALKIAGCNKIFTDHASGSKDQRPGLNEALEYLRSGDTLVVWRLDRLGRSLQYLITLVNELHKKEIGFKSLSDPMDTTSSGGVFVFNVFGSLAQFERDIIRERTNAGLAAARARGRVGGRPKSPLSEEKRLLLAKKMYDDKSAPVAEIIDTVKIPRSTFYKYVRGYT